MRTTLEIDDDVMQTAREIAIGMWTPDEIAGQHDGCLLQKRSGETNGEKNSNRRTFQLARKK